MAIPNNLIWTQERQIFKEQQICLRDLFSECFWPVTILFLCTPFTQTSCPFDRLLTVINKLCAHSKPVFGALRIALAKDITQHAVLIFVVLFKLDFSRLLFTVWIPFPREEDTTQERSNGSFIRTWSEKRKTRKKSEESKSSSRWQWIQDRKLLHRQFNFTQQNHKFLFSSIFTLCRFSFFIVFRYQLMETITIFSIVWLWRQNEKMQASRLRLSSHHQRFSWRFHIFVEALRNMWKHINHLPSLVSTLRRKFSHGNYPTVIFLVLIGDGDANIKKSV